jgi:hypothetical protein
MKVADILCGRWVLAVCVHIDESRCDHQTGHIDVLFRLDKFGCDRNYSPVGGGRTSPNQNNTDIERA